MAGLDPAILCERQMRGSSPRMTWCTERLIALRVKEWWEAGPPRCLLQRV